MYFAFQGVKVSHCRGVITAAIWMRVLGPNLIYKNKTKQKQIAPEYNLSGTTHGWSLSLSGVCL